MDYFRYEKRLEYMLTMAGKGQFLSVKQMADKFECSPATIKRMIRHLKQKGHIIRYSASLRKFYIGE